MQVLDQQHDLEDAQEEDLARKQKLTDEVHALQDRNKSLRRQVDRIGESALRAGRQGARNPVVC